MIFQQCPNSIKDECIVKYMFLFIILYTYSEQYINLKKFCEYYDSKNNNYKYLYSEVFVETIQVVVDLKFLLKYLNE